MTSSRWTILGLIAGAVAILLSLALMFYESTLPWLNQAMLGCGLLLILISILARFSRSGDYIRSRGSGAGARTWFGIALIAAILIVIVIFFARHDFRWDLTEGKVESLAPETQSLLAELSVPVEITLFDRAGSPVFAEAQTLLRRYALQSAYVVFRIVDPLRSPSEAEKNGIKRLGLVVIKLGDHSETVDEITESRVTNALLRLVKPEVRRVLFLTGHDEHGLSHNNAQGYSDLLNALVEENIETNDLSLLRAGSVPDDVDLLVLGGPQGVPLEREFQALREYLSRGGNLLLMLDPLVKGGWDTLLVPYGIRFHDDMAVDLSEAGRLLQTDEFVTVVTDYAQVPITTGLEAVTLFPLSRSLYPMPEDSTVRLIPIAMTDERTWGETSLADTAVSFQAGKDIAGPLTIAIQAEKVWPNAPDQSQRILAIGDADFCSNAYFGLYGNRDFILNAIHWLVGTKDRIAIRPAENRGSLITLNGIQSTLLFLGTVILLPLLALVFGLWFWLRRK